MLFIMPKEDSTRLETSILCISQLKKCINSNIVDDYLPVAMLHNSGLETMCDNTYSYGSTIDNLFNKTTTYLTSYLNT